ncbi:RSB1-integral membrane transporter [Fusarium agapanthi]|uniref:RSB1-integral membrane transporter n=1 Tax=Fusarium agapanthi TaxID=1803897 RepID=A0A9P5E461_9HYPO|nr:RSB1-integral membrane transporter [Fusarium agapanthi]
MSNTTNASGPLTQEQVDALRSGCQSLIEGIDTSYDYVPTLGAGIAFCVLFGLSLFGHFVQFVRKRQWTSFAFGVGALTEVIGWAGRTWSSECPYNNDAFLMQIITLIIAPTFITAGLYVILGALINRLGRESSVLGPRMYAIVFLSCDIIALIVQAVGGAMASTESDKIDGDTKPGTNIMVAGIVFQMAAMVVFAALVIDFLRRVFVKKSYLKSRKQGISDGNALPKAYTWLLAAVFISLTMIFIRSIYRTVELLQGWSGYLITHEGYFIGLDGATMVVAIAVFNFFDPVYLLWGQDDKLASSLGQNELRGAGDIINISLQTDVLSSQRQYMASSNPPGSSVRSPVPPQVSPPENEAEPDDYQPLKTQLMSLIQADNITEVEGLLNRNRFLANASILYEAEKNQQPVVCLVLPLTIAATFGRVTILEMLWSKFNADINAPTHRTGSQSLHLAAEYGWLVAATLLLSHGADIDRIYRWGWTALHYACRNARTHVNQGPETQISTPDLRGNQPLHHAARDNNHLVIPWLLEKQADIEAWGESGLTPLCVASIAGSFEADEVLLSRGANIHANSNVSKATPVLFASKRHITLDQCYYSVLTNTDTRDRDQVLSKFIEPDNKQTSGTNNSFHDPTPGGQGGRILMVDQRWFWVVDETTTEKEPDSLLVETIKRSLTGGETRSRFTQPQSIHMFIEQNLGITTRFFEWPIVGLRTPLDVFRESIRTVANDEAKLFKVFRNALEAERAQHNSPHRAGHAVQVMPSNPYHIISDETTFLEKIRDIRDELRILNTLADDQDAVWKQMSSIYRANGKLQCYYLYTPADAKNDLTGSIAEAETAHDSINLLLDLRQKQASIKEAEFGRSQAINSARQSNSILIFTIVTIIFVNGTDRQQLVTPTYYGAQLPLSFLSSLFALDVSSFPHESGELSWCNRHRLCTNYHIGVEDQ